MAHYSIGEFAKKTGLSISTLRYYEQEKLIYSHREENNRRYYDDSDIAWTQFIIILELAQDEDLPIIERASFAAIFANNLDEFFMVRVA